MPESLNTQQQITQLETELSALNAEYAAKQEYVRGKQGGGKILHAFSENYYQPRQRQLSAQLAELRIMQSLQQGKVSEAEAGQTISVIRSNLAARENQPVYKPKGISSPITRGMPTGGGVYYQKTAEEKPATIESRHFAGTVPYITTKQTYKTGLEVTPSAPMQSYGQKFPQFKQQYQERGVSILPPYKRIKEEKIITQQTPSAISTGVYQETTKPTREQMYEYKALTSTGFKKAAYGTAAFTIAGLKSTRELIFHPIQSTIGTYQFVKGIFTQETHAQLFQAIKERPFGTAGSILGPAIVFGKIAPLAARGVREVPALARSYKAPETVFGKEALAGGLPRAGSIERAESLFAKPKFGKGEALLGGPQKGVVVSSVTPELFAKETRVMTGERGDLGLFVTPKGEASAYFARIPEAGPSSEISLRLLPRLVTPRVIDIRVSGVERLPRGIISSQAASNAFLIGKAGKGTAYITRGSEIGLGLVKSVRGGTPELEATIPPQTLLRKVPGKSVEFTRFRGEPVLIEEYSVVLEKGKGNVLGLKTAGKLSKEVSRYGYKSGKEVSALELYGYARTPVSKGMVPYVAERSSRQKTGVSYPSAGYGRVAVSGRSIFGGYSGPAAGYAGVGRSSLKSYSGVPAGYSGVPVGRIASVGYPLSRAGYTFPKAPSLKGMKGLRMKPFKYPTSLKIGRELRYRPSVVGIEYKYKARKVPKELTGLEIRGVVM